MINQFYALGLTCNVCGEQSCPIKLDRTRYLIAEHIAYTDRMHEKAQLLGKKEGFVLIEHGITPQQSKHVCGNCAKLFASKLAKSDKASKPNKSDKLSKKVVG